MKLRNLFIATAAIAGLFTACSNEMADVVNTNNPLNEGTSYASFAIQMPSAAATRAANDTEAGEDKENQITDITLLFFDAAAPHSLKDIKTLSIDAFNGNIGTGIWTSKEAFTVTKGSRLIYAFVNAQPSIKGLAANDGGVAYGKITGVGAETAASMSIDNKFTMSNAETVTATTLEYETADAAIAAPVNMKVERTVAKVKYTGTNFSFDVTSPGDASVKVGKITLTNMQLVNTNDKYYYLRRVSSNATGTPFEIGGTESDGVNYVVDPNFTSALPGNDDNFGKSAVKTLAKDLTFYCLENTMNKDAQYQGVTTGAMFQATVQLEGESSIKTFYRYNGKIYTDVEQVKKDADIPSDVTSWTAEDWSKKNVDFYKDGICYYPYWIKHVDNFNAAVMGIMEFGVVRNNVYKLNVTNIKAIGQPTDKVDPENPDETATSYIAVQLEVKKWTIRSNENIEL